MKFSSGEAIVITISGLLIVFSVLILLVGIIKLFGIVFSSDENKSKKEAVVAKPQTDIKVEKPLVKQEDGEVMAVISAAVYAYSYSQNTNYRIKSVKPAKSSRSARPVWAFSGINQNTKPF